MRLGVIAATGAALAALAAAVSAPGSTRATPQPQAFTCKFEQGIAVVVDARRGRTTITDAGRTVDQFGQPVQAQDSNRLVATLTTRGLSAFAGCRRATPARRARTGHLIGPWPARVFSRLLCGYYGPSVRLDAFPVRGGGYRLTIAWQNIRVPYAMLSVTMQPRLRGGVSFEDQGCIRLGK